MQETHQNLISQNDFSTVVAHYEAKRSKDRGYQSEEALEKAFIQDLQLQGYEYASHIKDYPSLKENLKTQLERLNNVTFSNKEWERFYKTSLANTQKDFKQKTKMIQEKGHTELLERDDGSEKNIKLLDTHNLHNNHLQIINQFHNDEGSYKNRYDVSILVNGLPLVHIELKKRGVQLKEAFNQIKRYARESFSKGDALFEYVQIFVISNGTQTKYYSNSTQYSQDKSKSKQNASFSFTMFWSDSKNNIILDLEDFTKTFFSKRTLLAILTRFCVFNTDDILLIMRPYQIAASERILEKITIAHNHKLYGSKESGGYIWHSTGSGKTLTSFKTAQLACELPFIKKVLFVVDRKDLDYQTMKEYDKFQKGAANSTKNTNELQKALENSQSKIIITTIQKLSIFVNKYKKHSIFDEEVVIIFDECHRSQFGDMHRLITKAFKKYYLFGFSGTPIMKENAPSGKYSTIKDKDTLGNETQKALVQTTETTFGICLHTYTIVNAIKDENVLPFRVEYINTIKEKEIQELESKEQVNSIDTKSALNNPERIATIVEYILTHFDSKTLRNKHYSLEEKRLKGFNSIFATQEVEAAKAYYAEFKKQQEHKPKQERLKIGIIYSYIANENLDELDSGADTKSSKEFLESAIKDYNAIFGTSFDTSVFENYYKDISKRLKDKELDILIVVNMFLTGFDAKTLNTLWVDKNLKYHSLMQAFSRTNRIYNEVKNFGNVVCFRNLEQATNDSLKLYGDKKTQSIALLRSFKDYLEGYTDENQTYHKGYKELTKELKENFSLSSFPLSTDTEEKDFIKLFNRILKLENILRVFDEFSQISTLTHADKQDYQSHYVDIWERIRPAKATPTRIDDDIVFEIELIKQVEVNVEYIMFLLQTYSNKQDSKIKQEILKSLESSPSLRNKKELLREFLELLSGSKSEDFDSLFKAFIKDKYKEHLQKLIESENLQKEKAKDFLYNAIKIGEFQELGVEISEVLPKMSIFAGGKQKEENEAKRKNVIAQMREFFDRFKEFAYILVEETK